MEGTPKHNKDPEKVRAGILSGLFKKDRKNRDDTDKHFEAQQQIYRVSEEGDILPPDPSLND